MMKVIVVVVIGTVLSAAAEPLKECRHLRHNGTAVYKCYRAITQVVSFFEAYARCKDMDGFLASVKDYKQLSAVNCVAENSGHQKFWLGASCEPDCGWFNKGAWYWMSDNSPVLLDNWHDEEPNYDYDNQRVMLMGFWTEDRRWDDTEHFVNLDKWAICEYCTDDPEKADDDECVEV